MVKRKEPERDKYVPSEKEFDDFMSGNIFDPNMDGSPTHIEHPPTHIYEALQIIRRIIEKENLSYSLQFYNSLISKVYHILSIIIDKIKDSQLKTDIKTLYDGMKEDKLPEPTDTQQVLDEWKNEEFNPLVVLESIKTAIHISNYTNQQYETIFKLLYKLYMELHGEYILRKSKHDMAELRPAEKKQKKGGKSRRRHRKTKRKPYSRRR